MEFALSYSLSSSSISFLVFFARLFKLFGLVFPSLSSSISFIIFLYSSISSRVLFVPTPLITSMIGCFSSSVVSGSSFEGSSASGTIFSSGISSGIPGVVSAFSFSSTGDIFSSPPLSPSSITLAFSSKRVSSLCNLGDSSFNVVGNSSSSSGPSGPPRVSSSTLSASSFNSDERDSRFSGSSSITGTDSSFNQSGTDPGSSLGTSGMDSLFLLSPFSAYLSLTRFASSSGVIEGPSTKGLILSASYLSMTRFARSAGVSAFSFSSTGDIFSSSVTLSSSSKRVSSLCNLGDSSFNVVGNSSSSSGPSGPPRVSSSTLSASSFNSDERDSRFSGSSSIISSSIFLCRLSSSFLPLTISPLSAPISSLSFSVISSTGSFSESLGTSGTEEGIGIFSGIFL